MRTHLKNHWPLAAALTVFAVISAVILAISLSRTDGRLVYSLDDPYIHMAMAKNFVQHGVWGVTRYEFSSSTSSLLWTLLISGIYFITGPDDSTAYVINLAFQASLIVLLYFVLNRYILSRLVVFILLLMIPLFAAIPAIVVTGQEHILQAILMLAFVYASVKELSRDRSGSVLPAVLAPLVTGIRYEGLFLILPVCALFALRRRWRQALVIGSLGVLPLIVYAGICRMYDWPMIPAPLVIKGALPDMDSVWSLKKYLLVTYSKALRHTVLMHMLIALVGMYVLWFRHTSRCSTGQCMLAIALTGCLLHLLFSSGGNFARYETSIIIVGLVAFCITLLECVAVWQIKKPVGIQAYAPAAALGLLMVIPLAGRVYQSLAETPSSTVCIYRQQCQMAAFLGRFYQGCPVAANDIGAINYFADIRCLDLVGLGTVETCRLMQKKAFQPGAMSALAKANDVKIAIIYNVWFTGGLPNGWEKVGEWSIPNPLQVASGTVSFYAVDPTEKARLIECLRAFSPSLPAAVKEDGDYVWESARREVPSTVY